MGADDAAMAAFGSALVSGAAPVLKVLDLRENKIGDEGMRHLGDALARGAAPALEELSLYGNLAIDAAQLAGRDTSDTLLWVRKGCPSLEDFYYG